MSNSKQHNTTQHNVAQKVVARVLHCVLNSRYKIFYHKWDLIKYIYKNLSYKTYHNFIYKYIYKNGLHQFVQQKGVEDILFNGDWR